MGLEVVFDNHPVRKQTFLGYKNIDFKQWRYWVFSKGLTHDFGQKLEISSLFVFAQNGFEIMFDDHLDRKETLPDHKNIDFRKLPYWIISKGFTYDFSNIKNWNFPRCLFLDKMGLEIMFDSHLRRNQATLDYKISIYKIATLDFLKEFNPRFWSKIGNLFFICDI